MSCKFLKLDVEVELLSSSIIANTSNSYLSLERLIFSGLNKNNSSFFCNEYIAFIELFFSSVSVKLIDSGFEGLSSPFGF